MNRDVAVVAAAFTAVMLMLGTGPGPVAPFADGRDPTPVAERPAGTGAPAAPETGAGVGSVVSPTDAASVPPARVGGRTAGPDPAPGPGGGTTGGGDDAGTQAELCPAAHTCPLYKVHSFQWPLNEQGEVVIAYYIDPTQHWVPPQVAIDAVRAAAETWMAANPVIRLEYQGTTTTIEAELRGAAFPEAHVVRWRYDMQPTQVAEAVLPASPLGSAHLNFNAQWPWDWWPCEQADDSCTDIENDDDFIRAFDIQAAATHEFGHWLGLDDLLGDEARELTMHGHFHLPGSRWTSTLGLGDILGVRAAYPCGDRCPPIRVYVP